MFTTRPKKLKSYNLPACPFRRRAGKAGLQAHKGFTLIEMIVAVSVFVVVMVSGIGALVSMLDANRKAQSLRIVMDNLNFALENMTRGMRVGVDYHCGSVGDLNTTRDCPVDGDNFIAFTDSSGDRIIFRLNNGRIEKSEDLGVSFLGITAPEIVIEELSFFVQGSTEGDGLQPKVLVIVRGVAGVAGKTDATFSLQTIASQRLRDVSVVAPPPPPPETPPEQSVVFADGMLSSPTGLVHTFPSVSFGTVSSFRKVIVGLNYGGFGYSDQPSSVTIGGVTATLAVRRSNSWNSGYKLDLWQADVPTGTSGDVIITFNNSPTSLNLLVWSAYSLEGAVYDTAGTDGPGIAEATSLSVPIDVPAGGVALGFFWATGTQGSDFSATWTNLTENFETGVTTGYSGAGDSFVNAQTNLTVTAQANGVLPDGLIQLVVVSWGPQ